MFVLRSTHTAALKQAEESHRAVIAALEARISDLHKLVFVQAPTREQEHPIRVANAVLDGTEVMPQENERLEEEMREANRILSGSYDAVEETW